jgi:Family of unknown function (DUF6370)
MIRLFSISTLVLVFTIGLRAQSDTLMVDAACGQCMFDIKEPKGCDLAIRYKDKVYFVDGTNIDDHGDAHAHDGFCQAVSKAKVTGEFVNRRFVARSFKLVTKVEGIKEKGRK